jgi:exosortase E/protease (VPEID-CTERM system)
MTVMSPSPDASQTLARAAWMWRGALLAVLLGEYLAVSLTFDIRPLAERGDWLRVFGGLGAVGPLALAVATATFLLGGRELRSELREVLVTGATSARDGSRGRSCWLLAVHGIAFGALFTLTQMLVQASTAAPPRSLALAWVGAGLAVLLTAVHAIVPFASLVPLLLRRGRVLGVGAAVGLGAWAAGVWAERLWPPLADATLVLASGLLRAVGAEVSADPETATLGVNGFEAVISPVCSGYQGIGLLVVLTAAYLWSFRHELRFPIVLLVVPLGVALVWLANGVRIAALVAVGAWVSPEVALGGFHSKAGWILFCAIALGLVALTRRSLFSRRAVQPAETTVSPTWNPTASYLMPLLALVAAGMLTSLLESEFDLLYAAGPLAAALVLWTYRGDHRDLITLGGSWSACALGVATFALWVALEPTPDRGAVAAFERGLTALPRSAEILWIVCRFVGSVAIVPVVEEIAFRGYLLRRLISADFTAVRFGQFTWTSFLGSSLAFGLLHQSWLAGCIAGMLFALAQYRRGRLGDAILAHAVANLLVACYALGWGRWSLWT